MPYQQGNLSVILIRLVGFTPIHAYTGDEKDCLYIKDAGLGKKWGFSGLSATDGDLSVEERDMKTTASREYTSVCLYMEVMSEWNVLEHENKSKKKENINQDLNSCCFSLCIVCIL